MKKTLLTLGVVASTLTLSAQSYDIQAILTTPAPGATVAASSNQALAFDIKNAGPDALPMGDTLYFAYTIGTDLYAMDGTINTANGVKLPAAVPANITLPSAALGSFAAPALDLSGITVNTQVCGFALGLNSAALSQDGDTNDPTQLNNLSCFTATPSSASLAENSKITATVYPNPASDVLNVTSEEVVSTVSVLSMSGQMIKTSNSTSVNISDLNSGMYYYVVTTLSGSTAIGNFVKK